MTEILTKTIIDCSTGEQSVIPLTSEEMDQIEVDRIAFEEAQAEAKAIADAKEAARQSGIAKLLALGLTEEEANALVK
jgi:hypothetical protein